jgi:L-aspartate oxidase
MQHLGALLMANVGIVRSHHSLSEAVQQIESTLKELNSSVSGNIYARLTYNRHLVAWLIARAALLRTESRGGHFRSDYPQTNPVAETYRTLICGTQITHVSL